MDHGHPRLVGLRYAPLVRELHRPLVLRFLVEQSVEVDALRSRQPMRVVHIKPPPFMGPPSKPPVGAMTKPPSTLPEPFALIATLDAGQGMVGYSRPTSMAPPNGRPTGPRCSAPRHIPAPSESSKLASREMVAPQKLATLKQLLRRIAAATDELHFGRTLAAGSENSNTGGCYNSSDTADGNATVDLGALTKLAMHQTKGKSLSGTAKNPKTGGNDGAALPRKKKKTRLPAAEAIKPPPELSWLDD